MPLNYFLNMPIFAFSTEGFVLNGRPFTIISGSIHYFRVPPIYWKDRLLKLKLCGLNTVETYVAWNLHEPSPGKFDFSGTLDLGLFIETADQLGLQVILRPGPYICSEWDLGGLPAWLLKDPLMRLRTCHPSYLEAVDRYLVEFWSRFKHFQISNGGPVIAVQLENEYSAYGNDNDYLEYLWKKTCLLGVEVPLFTSDHRYLDLLPQVLKTANFGSKAIEKFTTLRKYQPEGPLACMEFWCGWFDSYGKPRPEPDINLICETLDTILKWGLQLSFICFTEERPSGL